MVSDTGKVLLIGDVNKVFSDPQSVYRLPFELCDNVLDAIDAASKGQFAAIAVAISGLSGRLKAILKALNQSSSNTKIVLLAQMYEEPAARQLTVTSMNGTPTSYLICPAKAEELYKAVLSDEKSAAAGEIDATIIEKMKQLEKLATTDELTGLKNRRYLLEFSRQIIELEKTENGRVTLLVFDIDDFKHYNDRFGHAAGDNILKQAAVLMQRSCRQHDVVGRIGGDEFAVIFWDGPRKRASKEDRERRSAQAEHPREPIFIAKRFQKELEKAEFDFLGPKGKGILTISGGLASFPRDGATVEDLLQRADEALLQAKRSGKNRIYLVGSSKGDIADIE